MKGRKGVMMVVMALAVMTVCAGICFAMPQGGPGGQGEPPQPPSASEIVQQMKMELNLTDEQVAQITPLVDSEMAQMKALMDEVNTSKPTMEEMKTKMDAIHAITENSLASILTAEQLTQWKNRRQPGGPHGDGMPPSGECPGMGQR